MHSRDRQVAANRTAQTLATLIGNPHTAPKVKSIAAERFDIFLPDVDNRPQQHNAKPPRCANPPDTDTMAGKDSKKGTG